MRNRDKAKEKEYNKRYYQEHREQAHCYYEANREQSRKQSHHYRETHPEQVREYQKHYQREHREQLLKQRCLWYQANREKIREYNKHYHQEHRIQARCYRKANRERERENLRRWRKANPEQHREHCRRRHAKLVSVIHNLTVKEWQHIKEIYDHRCAYCGEKKKKLTQDHVVPISKGGSHTISNVVPACQSCNSRKGTGEAPAFQRILILALEGN
jgi:hypothetical protein